MSQANNVRFSALYAVKWNKVCYAENNYWSRGKDMEGSTGGGRCSWNMVFLNF